VHRGVEVLVAGLADERDAAHGLTDPAVVDELDRGLDGAAKECVGRTADPDAGVVGRLEDLTGRVQARRQGLLAPDVLAGHDRGQARLGVGERRGQIHHQLDLWVVDQLLGYACPRHAMPRCLLLGARPLEVGARHDLEQPGARDALEVLLAYVAAAENPNLHGPHARRTAA
jgi:hypothetical protein